MCRFAQTELSASPAAAGQARSFVKDACLRWELDDLADDLALLVSELVTNAVLHAQSPSVLTVSVAEGTVEVSVADAAPTHPVLRPGRADVLADLDAVDSTAMADDVDVRADAHAVGEAGSIFAGRGLHLVDAIADEWGTAPAHTGKVVWLTMSASPSGSPQQHCVCAHSPTHRTASGRAVAQMVQ